MNLTFKSLVKISAAVLALASGLAQAGDATVAPEIDNFVSMKTRAEVHAETLAAIRGGRIARNDADFERLAFDTKPSMLTRAQVLAEAAEARRLGLIAHGDGAAPVATPAQLERIRMAGLRTLTMTAAR
jgi:hypothetical protein